MKYLSDGFRRSWSRKAAAMWREECAEKRKRDAAARSRALAQQNYMNMLYAGNDYISQMSADRVIHEWQDGRWECVSL